MGTLSIYEKVMASQQMEREGFEGLRPCRFHVSRRGGQPFVTEAHGFLAGSKERMTPAEQAAFAESQLDRYYWLPQAQEIQEGRGRVSPWNSRCHARLRRFKNSKAAIGAIRAGSTGNRGASPACITSLAQGRKPPPNSARPTRSISSTRAATGSCLRRPDFRIELDRFAKAHGHTIEFYQYFRTDGANRGTEADGRLRKLTRIDFPEELARRYKKPFFWPDGIFVLRAEKKRVLCLVEAYRGDDTGRVMQQLVWHIVALDHGLPSEKYGMKMAHRVLLVFEGEEALAAVLQRLLRWDSIHEHRQFIACSTIERLMENFRDWYSVREGEISAGGVI